MLDKEKSLEMLNGFSAHYNYDASYMKEMLHEAPAGFETFEAFLPMARFSKSAPLDVLFVAKIIVTKNEDCGSCLQLTIDMAVEAGVDKTVIEDVVFKEGKSLPSNLKLVYDFALAITQNRVVSDELYAQINEQYSKETMIELALAIASAKVFPTIKRTLNDAKSCSMITLKV